MVTYLAPAHELTLAANYFQTVLQMYLFALMDQSLSCFNKSAPDDLMLPDPRSS